MRVATAVFSLLGLSVAIPTYAATLAKYEVQVVAKASTNTSFDYMEPHGLSANRWIVGNYVSMAQTPAAFRCSADGACTGPNQSLFTYSHVDVNSSGTAVGTTHGGRYQPNQGFIWDVAGNVTYIPYNIDKCPWMPLVYRYTSAAAINKRGVVLAGGGRCHFERVITFFNGIETEVPLPAGAVADGEYSVGHDINDLGQIVGYAFDEVEGVDRSFFYDGMSSQWLSFNALLLNNNGQIGGTTVGADGRNIPILRSNGVIQQFPTLGDDGIIPTGLNRHGDMVGTARIDGKGIPVLMTKGRTKRLQSLLREVDRTAWTLETAADINGSGEIVSSATQTATGEQFVVLLIPINP